MEKLAFPFLLQEDKILNWRKVFHGRLGDNQGQTLVTWLILVSLVLLITTAVGSGFGLIQGQMQLTHICRIESLKVQADVEPLIKKLFGLNNQAKLLRIRLGVAKAKLALALIHLNMALAAESRIEISIIRKQQHILEKIQKSLIQTANIKLHSGTFSTYQKLKSAFIDIKKRSAGWADINFVIHNPIIPRLAVKPLDRNLAPVYVPKKNFEKKQVTSQMWKQKYTIKGFLKEIHQSNSQCHATLEENSWVPKIRRDKLYSKWH